MRRKTYNYTSNLELTSLLIRIKNYRNGMTVENSVKMNHYINDRIFLHTKLSDTFYKEPEKTSKKQRILEKLKNQIIDLSDKFPSDDESYNRFGKVILLMIKHILTRPQFSGYTYKDDFFSDAVYKILRYLGNFDYTKISKYTGTNVNAFSYVTQIIRMSILFIINAKKAELDNLKSHANLNLNTDLLHANDLIVEKERDYEQEKITKHLYIKSKDPMEIFAEIRERLNFNKENVEKIIIYFPKCVVFSADDYNRLKELQNELKIIDYGNRYEV